MSCCSSRRTCACAWGAFLGSVGLGGGRAGGLGLLEGGGGVAREALQGIGGLNPELDNRISSSA